MGSSESADARYLVLVGMDFSELADLALRRALDLASRRRQGEVHVACIVPPSTTTSSDPLADPSFLSEAAVIEGVFESLRARIHHALEAFRCRAEFGNQRIPSVLPQVTIDAPGRGLAQLERLLGADLIVLGASGQGNARSRLGSTARGALRFAHCPVMLLREEVEICEHSEPMSDEGSETQHCLPPPSSSSSARRCEPLRH